MNKKFIFLIGLIFRLALVFYIVSTNPYHWDFFNNPDLQGSDQGDFTRLVKNIVDERKFSFDGIISDQFRTPIFPFFAALSYWLTGGFLLYTLLNILVSSAIGVVAYEIAWHIFAHRRLAFWSGLIFNLLPYGAYLSAMLMADNLFALFFALYVLFFIKILRGDYQAKNLILTGLFLALATLTRPMTQYLIIISIIFIFFLRLDCRAKWRNALILFIVFILASSPWLIRNYLIFQKPVFSSLGGYHMFVSWIAPYRAYIKNHIPRSEEAEKTYQYIKDKYGKYGSEAMYDPVISAKLGNEAKQEILSNWQTYIPFHILSGTIFYMNNDALLTLSEVFHINSGNIYAFQHLFKLDFAGFFKNIWQLNWLYLIVYFGSYFLIFGKNILVLIGIKKYFKTSWLIAAFALFLLIYFPLLVGPEGHARFRYPIEPLLLIFALSVFSKVNCRPRPVSLCGINSNGNTEKSDKIWIPVYARLDARLAGMTKENKFKLIYIVNARIPTEKAHGVQIAQMLNAFANFQFPILNFQLNSKNPNSKLEIELVIPNRFNPIKQNLFQYYGVKNNFKITKLPVIDLVPWNIPLAFQLETITFAISTFVYLLFHHKNIILYTRGEMILFLAPLAKLFKIPIFWETHIKPDNIAPYQKLFPHIKGFITVTEYYRKELIEKYGIPADKIICAPDGVDLEKFNIQISKNEACAKLSLPLDKKIVLYSGSLISWKGADIFLKTSELLPDDVLLLILAGGEQEDIQLFNYSINNLAIKNIMLLKHRPPAEIPLYLKSADLLILTGTKKSATSLYYTSPLKLFEYMASDRPILSADILSFKEILNDENAFFYEADNAADLAKKIKYIFSNYELAKQKSTQALRDVQNYSWQKRTEKILTIIDY